MDFRFIIEIGPDGQLKVNGPLENKIVCLGALELAKQAVIAYEPKRVAVAAPGVLHRLDGGRGEGKTTA